MNWSYIRKQNARASARKAKRERRAAELTAMQERLGGDIKVDELRAAPHEWRECRGGYGPFRCEVWTLRGREWRIVFGGGSDIPVAVPHEAWRQDPRMKEYVHLTAGARKWLLAEWAKEEKRAEEEASNS